jgi:uroporphyrinogen-III synthase
MDTPDLHGLRVLVTRPAHQAEPLAQLIEAAGGEAVRFPVVEILDTADSAALHRILDRLSSFDIAVFISPNAVNKAMNLIQGRAGLPPHLQLACVGRGSAKALKHFGREADIVPDGRFDSEALLARDEFQQVGGKKIVIFRGDGGREVLGDTLKARGAEVEYAECYRRAKPHTDTTPLLRRWARGEIDLVTITSVDGLRNLFDLVGKLGQQWLIKTPVLVVSERMANVCRELGFKTEPIVAEPSDEGIVAAARAWRRTQNSL